MITYTYRYLLNLYNAYKMVQEGSTLTPPPNISILIFPHFVCEMNESQKLLLGRYIVYLLQYQVINHKRG